ncbi:MAG: FlgD immunoglobulin-like domain containing protein [Candidatus Cloacimonetes bacterium]|nr:FlgD immunoglobulin-like domain containing protein [Candidatus Cloacimonadota bacterium]MDD4277599.1 FlgD immunoglobulin-like domain containing protein [Candidatus Cloacimonadota bacterium]MDY0326492.1 FlgD immunoglobulin-like domain containing protein [Candidatus Cloacimonadaceae bacterium]
MNAYITNITDPSEELKSMEFRMYFPGKTSGTNVLKYSVLNPQSGTYESRRVKLGECKGFLQVKIGATETPPLPQTTRLYQNYPNPFNPETSIRFDLKEDGFVEIGIYNLKGQKVRSLVNDVKSAGSYTEIWNGTDNNGRQAASGVYFFRMHTHNQTLTNKMILMK